MAVRHAQARFRHLAGDRRGNVSIEFALAALPFILLVTAIFELGLMILQDTILFGALEEGARQLRTGVVQTADDPEATFQEILCENLFAMLACDDVLYDVQAFSSYQTVAFEELTLGDDGLPTDTTFNPGGASEITAVRVYALYNFVTPFLEELFEDSANGRLMTYTAVVKGEPWD